MNNRKPIKITSSHIKSMIRESINEIQQERNNRKKHLTESRLKEIIKEAINEILKEGYGYNRQQGANTGMARSLMGQSYIDAYQDEYNKNDKNMDAAHKHGMTNRQSQVGRERAVSSYDPLALRQRMNQLGNNPQDTLRKSRKYGHLNINNK